MIQKKTTTKDGKTNKTLCNLHPNYFMFFILFRHTLKID